MDVVQQINDVLLWLGVALALTTIALLCFEHIRARVPQVGWLVAALATYAVTSFPISTVGYDVAASNNPYALRILPFCVFALPGLLARVVEAMCGTTSRLHRASDAVTLALLAIVIAAPAFPGTRTEQLPTWYYLVIAAFCVELALALVASWRTVRVTTQGQPAPTRLRGAALIGSLATFSFSYAAWVIAPGAVMEIISSAVLLASGELLMLAVLAPRTLLYALARNHRPADTVFEQLVASDDVRADLPGLLATTADAHGLLGLAVVDADGHLIEAHGHSELEHSSSRTVHESQVCSHAGGITVIVWSTALTPPLRTSDRARLGLLATLVQITLDREAVDRHERDTAAALVSANERLSEANALKDRFVALVSHELRTPLTSIIGLARTSYERWLDLDPQQVREFQLLIAQQGERLAQIVEHLLMVSAIEAGAVRAELAPVDLCKVIATAAEDAGVYSAAHVAVRDELRMVEADERLVREILVNFLSNADKYAAPPFDVNVRTEGDMLELAVRDRGRGVTPELRERLFDRFTRDPANEVPGTGLGLAIAHDLALAMDGTVGHRDAPEGGSEFWLRIPLIRTGDLADSTRTGNPEILAP
jgi:two-component system sensor histidine kinase KdpD